MSDYPLRVRTGRDLKHYKGFIGELLEVGTPFQQLPLEEYKALPAAGRSAYNEARRRVVSRGIMVRNDSYTNVKAVLTQVMAEHQYSSGGGHGVLVSADSYMGKTTVSRILMLELLIQRLKADPDCLSTGDVPIAYVNLPTTGTPVGLYRMLAQFYGLPIGKRETEVTLEGMMQNAINKCRTELLVIDEVHNLKYGGVASPKVSAAIRRLGDDINCPILLSGIGLEKTNLLLGQEGAQIYERYRFAEMVSYDRSRAKSWRMLVQGLITAMPLFGPNTKGIAGLAVDLHAITNGRIGSLNSILSRVALQLISADDVESEILAQGIAELGAVQTLKETRFKNAVRRGTP